MAKSDDSSTRSSPPTKRVLGVLNLLAAEPADRRTLTAIATALGISPATCLGILNELVAGGYLVRHPDRTYSLGGALVSLGAAARDSRPGLGPARDGLQALSDDLGRLCTASAVIGDQIVVLEAVGPSGGAAPMVRAGARFPFTAPVGLVNAAWYPDETIAAWIDRSPVALAPDKLDRMRSVIATSRQQGYLVERLTNVEPNLHRLLPMAFSGANDDAARRALGEALLIFADRDYLTDELEEPEASSVSVICAPCFDADGRPELTLGVYVMEIDVPIGEIHAVGRRLRQACDRVTAAVAGHDPWP
jgi:DNA-binding IclR family transcriptional regulator